VLTWVTIPYIVAHFLVGHKELRFLFPLANIIPILLVFSIQLVKEDSRFYKVKNLMNASKQYAIRIFLIINYILLFVVCIKPADLHIYLYQYIYSNYDHEQTELSYIKKNPFYARAVPVNFYKKNNLKMINFENSQSLVNYIRNTDKTILFVTDKFELDPEMKAIKCSNVFQTIPRAATYVNVNNWLERTPKWILYECTNIDGK
jgi:phosphatidylinositol glycan class B